ncbi:AEC family transporter [Ideonella sp. 4Y11]|uniref:AEC family transporter n=1 Tax=Ideonella aquatica TaxID=2824119 RepID=A0A940YJH5_9BURK|nr:AEC family transporter [Ideonella aquatica]MBQ0960654.1 AEC family transporter [Ideonella aquatica]
MSQVLLLLPDFLLIVAGYLVCRHTALDRPVWDGVERLVYWLLFPVLLFVAILRQPLQAGEMLSFAGCGLAVVGLGIALAYALGHLQGVDALTHASGAQTAFRFNSYVGLAMAERLGGVQAVAWIALLIALCVPVCNVAAVWPLARRSGQHFGRELARNPLIVATVAGLLCNLAGLRLPEPLNITLTRVGSAALPLGLMAVGAGLQMGALRDAPRLAAAFLGIRHLLLPLWAITLVITAGLPSAQQSVVVAFAALPTASSAYVLATRMGGHGGFVAGLVSLSTLIAMLGLPLALAALGWAQAA